MANFYIEEIIYRMYKRTMAAILSCKLFSNGNQKATVKTNGMMMNSLQLDLLLGLHQDWIPYLHWVDAHESSYSCK